MESSVPSFVALWTRYQPEVRRYVCTLVPVAADAEDVMQQTAARIWEKFEQYNPERPFVAWAIGFAYHEVLSSRQRHARDRLVFSEDMISQLHATLTEESSLLELRRKALDGCLQKIDNRGRELLLCRYSQHGGVQREAEKSKTSPHKLYYAIEQLRSRLLACIDNTMRQEGWYHG
ncbi:MAG: sigma-70 family RNA polymerase sigma factor [Fuerstiella sp.]